LKKIPKINQVYFPYWEWECYHAGMFSRQPPKNMSAELCTLAYKEFLQNLNLFNKSMQQVALSWPKSCLNFLTNESINRIAWLGQSAMCIYSGISRQFRAGFCLLDERQKSLANNAAADFLCDWIYEKKHTTSDYGIQAKMEQMRLF
jgi:hypothetical protein